MLNFYTFDAGCILGNNLYFSSNSVNGLYCRNMLTGEINLLETFPGNKILQKYLHQKCIQWGEWIIFLPCLSAHVHLFNPVTKQMKKVAVNVQKDNETYVDGCVYNDILYLFPNNRKNTLIIYDLVNDTIMQDDFFYSWCNKEFKSITGDDLIFNRLCLKDNIVYLPTLQGGTIVQVNLLTKEISRYQTEPDVPFLLSQCGDTGWIACAYAKNEILYLDSNFSLKKKYSMDSEIRQSDKRVVMNIAAHGQNIFIMPGYENCIYKLDSKSGQLIRISIDMGTDYCKDDFHFYGCGVYKDVFIIYPRNAKRIVMISNEKVSYEDIEFCIEEYKKNFYQHYHDINKSLLKQEILMENKNITLQEFLELIN